MHYRPGHSMTFDSDGLQADVMRFMAIIAFCLIAILAVLQNVEPPVELMETEGVPESVPGIQQTLPVEIALPTARPKIPEMLSPVGQEVKSVVREPQPIIEELPQTVYKEQPQTVYKEQPQTVYKEQPQTVYKEQPQTVYKEQPQTVYKEQPQALALRFATDDAFVALISTDKIQLFARAGNEFYRMGANFGVTLAPATGTLYDLLPASVPEKISRIFKRVVTADGYLVALPADMQNELNRFLREVSGATQQGGTLVIHRNGHMSYEK